MKKIWLAILGVLAVAYGVVAQVNTTGNVTVTGVAPTTNTDTSALTNLTSIKVQRKLGSGAYANVATIPFTTPGQPFSYADNGLPNGTYCYTATAVNAQGNESVVSNEACRQVLVLFPRAPTNVQAN